MICGVALHISSFSFEVDFGQTPIFIPYQTYAYAAITAYSHHCNTNKKEENIIRVQKTHEGHQLQWESRSFQVTSSF